MVSISPALKEAFNPNNGKAGRYIDYVVTWGVVNQEAKDNAVPTAAEDTSVSRIAQITNGNSAPLKIATFENVGFSLDGSAVVPPQTTEMPSAEIGLILAELSDENGIFSTAQAITINFPYMYDWIALTVDFGLVTAVDFSITYYADTDEQYTTDIVNNSNTVYELEQGADGCNKVVISITKINVPFSHARISEITFGQTRRYTKSNSQGLEITESIDPLNERVPANELKISVENFAGEYNIFDPSGIYAYLKTRQKITPKIGAQQSDNIIEYVDMGNYYLQSLELKNSFSRLDIKATDLLGVLQDTVYTKGIYKTATLEEFLNDVATDAGVDVEYSDFLSNITVSAYIPSISHSEAFRRIAQAAGMLLYTNRDNVICLKGFNLDTQQNFTMRDYNSDSGLTPSDDSVINTIEVEAMYFAVSSIAEKLTEISGTGTLNVKYDPSVDHTITVSGGTLVSATYYVDNAIVEITGGTAIISGKKIVTNTSTIQSTIAQSNEQKQVYTVKGNPFISPATAYIPIENYLHTRAEKRRTVKMQYRGYPYIEMGDCVGFATGTYLAQEFCVTKNALKLSGGMTGTLEAREQGWSG